MNLGEILVQTFTDMKTVSAITSTVFIILLGYYFRKQGIFNETVSKTLSSVVLNLALPALAFTAFMKDIDQEQLNQSIDVLIWGILVYVILMLLTPLFYRHYDGDRRKTLAVLSIFGSTTFFGTPIVSSIYGDEGTIYANIFNIGYRIFLYTYGYIMMSGLKFEKKNLKQIFGNSIIIATFAGLLIWIFQSNLPQVTVTDAVTGEVGSYAFLRIDQTAYWLYRPLQYLAGLSSPLAWLSIGAQLGELDVKEAATNNTAWYYSIVKVVAVPLINLLFILGLNAVGFLDLGSTSIATTVIMMATPTATVAAAYAINFDRDATLASNASLLSTIAAVIAIPLWIVVLSILSNAGII
ncbi:malate permease [Suicoccus acidiformans]|uniref:Malate permease n=1 Tax=Suicoccus acidiformans TaxID=2036206 RepID=A0A347WJ03_9LACT|nr:AEC family transporter [Suicoccus acidiformans]AXY25060.1 malate permease [Suicoccus acidiformans]